MIMRAHSIFFFSKQFSIQLNWHYQNGKQACTYARTHTCVYVCVITPAGTKDFAQNYL